MKKTITLSLFALLFVSSINAQWRNKKVKGNGNITTETRSVGNYNGIGCSGSMDFVLVKGTEGEIKLEGESNLLEHIVTEIKRGDLIVKVKKNYNIQSSKGKTVKITIPFQDINKVTLAGSGDVITEDRIDTDKFGVSLAGSGDIILDINASDIKSSLAGSGDITLSGNTSNLKVSLAGSGDIKAFDLQSDDVSVSIAGSGDVQVTSNENLKVSIAGSGDVRYKGDPEVTKKVAGSGSVSKS